jgi:LPXTG-site transpeptidase (sortase) family protein
MTRPRPAYIVLGISLLVLILAPVWFLATGSGQSDSHVNSVGQSRVETPAQEVQQPVERIGTVLTVAEPIQVSAPVELGIAQLGVQAEIVPVGVDQDGQVVIPEDIAQVGWYKFGATPGSGQGSSVLVGHRDGRNYGKGAFYNVGSLNPGDTVTLRNAEDQVVTYRVTGRESTYKEELPMRELFRETGEEVLTLISCIGAYIPGVGYDQNVVITAVPIAGHDAD